jgi:hypothetical protein
MELFEYIGHVTFSVNETVQSFPCNLIIGGNGGSTYRNVVTHNLFSTVRGSYAIHPLSDNPESRSYYPSFSKNKQIVSIPRWKFGM